MIHDVTSIELNHPYFLFVPNIRKIYPFRHIFLQELPLWRTHSHVGALLNALILTSLNQGLVYWVKLMGKKTIVVFSYI